MLTQKDNDLGLTRQMLDEAIKSNPQDDNAYSLRGLMYSQNNNFTEALNDFNAAIKLNPKVAEYYYNRALVHVAQGNDDAALKDFNEALQRGCDESQVFKVYNDRGDLYYSQKKYDQALEDYNKAIDNKKYPAKNAQVFISRGNSYYFQQEYTAAIKDYNEAIQRDFHIENIISHDVRDEEKIFKPLDERLKEILRQDGTNLQFILPSLIKLSPTEKTFSQEEIFNKIKELVLIAVKQNGMALKFAGDFKNDKDVVTAALKQNRQAINYADQSLRNEPEIIALLKRKEGIDFIFDEETITLIRSGNIETINDFIELLQNIITKRDDNVVNAFIKRCEQEKNKRNNKNAKYYIELLSCITKLRDYWSEIKNSKDLYLLRQQLSEKFNCLTPTKTINQFSQLLNQLTEKVEKFYLQLINEYIFQAESECKLELNARQENNEKFKQVITKYVVNETIDLREKYSAFLSMVTQESSNLDTKKSIYSNINDQLNYLKSAAKMPIERLRLLVVIRLLNYVILESKLMLPVNLSNNNINNKKSYDNHTLSELKKEKELLMSRLASLSNENSKPDIQTSRAHTQAMLLTAIKEIEALNSLVDITNYLNNTCSSFEALDKKRQELIIIHAIYQKKLCALQVLIKEQILSEESQTLKLEKVEKEPLTMQCSVSQLNQLPHLPINKLYYHRPTQCTLLHEAIKNSQPSVIELLLKLGADIFSQTRMTNLKLNMPLLVNAVQLAIIIAYNNNMRNQAQSEDSVKVLEQMINNFTTYIAEAIELHPQKYLKEMQAQLIPRLDECVKQYCQDIKQHHTNIRCQREDLLVLIKALTKGIREGDVITAIKILKKEILDIPLPNQQPELVPKIIRQTREGVQNFCNFISKHQNEINQQQHEYQKFLVKYIPEESMDNEIKSRCLPALAEKKKNDQRQKELAEEKKKYDQMQKELEEMKDRNRWLEENVRTLMQRGQPTTNEISSLPNENPRQTHSMFVPLKNDEKKNETLNNRINKM